MRAARGCGCLRPAGCGCLRPAGCGCLRPAGKATGAARASSPQPPPPEQRTACGGRRARGPRAATATATAAATRTRTPGSRTCYTRPIDHFFHPDGPTDKRRGTDLPHWHQEQVWGFLTFSLADAIPAAVARERHAARARWLADRGIDSRGAGWRAAVDTLPAPLRASFHRHFNRDLMRTLDRGLGACVLAEPGAAAAVAATLLHGDGVRYRLGDFVVMPNHVHVLVRPFAGERLVGLATGWKAFSAKQIRRLHPGAGRFWQREGFDHLVRSRRQLDRFGRYIAENPRGLPAGSFLHHVAEREA